MVRNRAGVQLPRRGAVVTEDEARTKWCPHARVGDASSGAAESRPDGSFNCIASGCMMWEWDEEQVGEKNLYRNSATRGHCGLAGEPK